MFANETRNWKCEWNPNEPLSSFDYKKKNKSQPQSALMNSIYLIFIKLSALKVFFPFLNGTQGKRDLKVGKNCE